MGLSMLRSMSASVMFGLISVSCTCCLGKGTQFWLVTQRDVPAVLERLATKTLKQLLENSYACFLCIEVSNVRNAV